MDLELVIFSANFFGYRFRDETGNGAPFSINIRDRNWRLDLGFHTSWEATSVQICRKQQ